LFHQLHPLLFLRLQPDHCFHCFKASSLMPIVLRRGRCDILLQGVEELRDHLMHSRLGIHHQHVRLLVKTDFGGVRGNSVHF
jgi:hypothetical protein